MKILITEQQVGQFSIISFPVTALGLAAGVLLKCRLLEQHALTYNGPRAGLTHLSVHYVSSETPSIEY